LREHGVNGGSGKPLDRISEVLKSLRQVIRATDLHSSHLAKTAGVTAPQLLLMQAIRSREGATIGQLAAQISLSQATVSSILDRLEKRELIYRERSKQDKRKVHAQLTQAGIDVLRDKPVPLQEHFSRQFAQLQEWEQTMIISALQRVACMMGAQDLDASPILEVGALDRSAEKLDD
jgi:DNA-binding MarR family transcriptional regulator